MNKRKWSLIAVVIALTAVIICGCTEEDFTNSFQPRSKNDIMLIDGQKYDISNRLYTKMFDCIKDLNTASSSIDTEDLAKQIMKAKEYGTYIHLSKNDGKAVTYIHYKNLELLWGDIPSRTDATGKLTKKEGTYFKVTPQAKEEIRKAEQNAKEHPKDDEIIPE